MPALRNPKHERFAQELAKGKSASEAYVNAGYKPSRSGASHLQHTLNISQRVAEILSQRAEIDRKATQMAAEAVAVDKAWIMARLKENAERALQAVPVNGPDGETGEYKYEGSVANRSLELLGKEIGMFIDRKEVGKPGDFSELNDDELDRSIYAKIIAAGGSADAARAYLREAAADGEEEAGGLPH